MKEPTTKELMQTWHGYYGRVLVDIERLRDCVEDLRNDAEFLLRYAEKIIETIEEE